MSALDAADMTTFVDPDMPGYVLANIGGIDVGALFSNGYAEAFDMSGSKPGLQCVSADVSTAVDGTSVTINGTAYTVSGEPQPDGTGMTRLILEAV